MKVSSEKDYLYLDELFDVYGLGDVITTQNVSRDYKFDDPELTAAFKQAEEGVRKIKEIKIELEKEFLTI